MGTSSDENDEQMWSIPVDNSVDPHGYRTSQRAEILAAIEGVVRICEGDDPLRDHFLLNERRRHPNLQKDPQARVIAADSEYVVKGITEWYPKWEACNIHLVPVTT